MNVEEFIRYLSQQDRFYEACSTIPAPSVAVRFTGPFAQKTIIWDAQIATLAYHFNMSHNHNADPSTLRPFIEVGAESVRGRQLQVGLNVSTIDDATIQKTMIMIRQYKRLQQGRHEYGEPYQANEVG